MTASRVATVVEAAAMAGIGAAIWFLWNPLLRYLPGGLVADVNALLGRLGIDAGASAWLGWLGDVEWVVGVLLVVGLLALAEALAGRIRRLQGAQ